MRVRALLVGAVLAVAVAVLLIAAFLRAPSPTDGVQPVLATGGPPTAVSAPPAPSATRLPVAKVQTPSKPAALEIPAIGVHVDHLVELGLTADGALEVPKDALTAGWFTGGPTPGQVGPAVVAAHVDYRKVPGVFFRLKDMRPGEQVVVNRADRTSAVFTVYRVDRYPKSQFPTDLVYGDTPTPELRLITCGGDFDHSTGNYRDNVVVYARLAQAYLSTS
jgi:hypothetical protein